MCLGPVQQPRDLIRVTVIIFFSVAAMNRLLVRILVRVFYERHLTRLCLIDQWLVKNSGRAL